MNVPVYWSSISAQPKALNLLAGYNRGFAQGINNNGNIVGSCDKNDNSIPVYWASISAQPKALSLRLGTTLYSAGIAYGLNNNGIIVGTFTSGLNIIPVYWPSFSAQPQLLSTNNPDIRCDNTSYIQISAKSITADNFIVGYYYCDGANNVGIYWSDLTTNPQLFPGNTVIPSSSSSANGINDLKLIVGNREGDDTVSIPTYFLNPTSTVQDLPYTNAFDTWSANGINNTNVIVGSSYNSDLAKNSPVYWSSLSATPQFLSSILGVFTSDNAVAQGINDNGVIVGYLTAITALSNICFPAGTPVRTDQGTVPINQLDPAKHTINRAPIQHITQTRTLDKYLISFPPGSIRPHLPSQHTVMTKDHQIEFNGCMVPAQRFLTYSKDIKKVTYTGETLYNVLLATPGKMIVNDLVCETLHPENIIAKLYTQTYTDEERTDLVMQLNESLTTRNLDMYKNTVKQLK